VTAPGEYGPSTYGDRWADVYDDWFAGEDPGPAVERLVELAGGAAVLELAVGTGRIAIPLAAKGVPVTGVDASEAMLRRLREKAGGDRVPVVVADMAELPITGEFSVVVVAFNSFFNLTTADSQRRCLESVARRLSAGGTFALEAFVPDLRAHDLDQAVEARTVEPDRVVLRATRHDPRRQLIHSTLVEITEQGIRLLPLQARYAWPDELDAMAAAAGLRLVERFASWTGDPFSDDSPSHVSLYRRNRT
jgi:SAM-dependent methyltransferase